MSFLKSFFLFLALAIGTFAFSHPYERQIKEMILEDASTRIKLSDNSIWMTSVDTKQDLLNWQIGDPIALNISSNEYFLQNQRNSELLKVLFYNHQDLSQEVYHVQEISPNCRLLRLDDQSIWYAGYLDSWSTQNWKEKDRVMIFPASNLRGYYLLNMDSSDSHECVYAYYRFKPYQQTYRHFIANINYDLSNCYIQLDNGFVCQLRKSLFGSFDEKIATSWQAGDEVNLYCNIRMETRADGRGVDRRMDLDLINLRTLQTAHIFFKRQEGEWTGLKIVQIDGYHGFFNYEVFLTLEDGSYWKITDSNYNVHHWQVGDRVLVSSNLILYGRSEEKSYCLLNPDHGQRAYWKIFSNHLSSAAQGNLKVMIEAPSSRPESTN